MSYWRDLEAIPTYEALSEDGPSSSSHNVKIPLRFISMSSHSSLPSDYVEMIYQEALCETC